MKKQTLRERRISYEKEALKHPMTEMEAAERIRKLIARQDKETSKDKSSAKSAKTSTNKKHTGNLASLGITSLGDPIL
ncbi:hypothetical protein OAA86_08495 [Rhodospirillales bacterium]|nr:hypothetical protein [Rhodospirillales bacterium]